MALNYNNIREDIEQQILSDRASGWRNPYRFEDSNALRRNMERDIPNLQRPAFVRDIEKILHLPPYNRYNDKTQVFSFYHNDDISRRGLHVQLVSRISRNIGSLLGLNTDLIEAIALGHDIGHTPFGHTGEHYLDELLQRELGVYFNHNVHSVRVLDHLYQRNLTLQTLDGIVCHNGEFELGEYRPVPLESFEQYDMAIDSCYRLGNAAIERMIPSTLEGCVVRISDMIAYIGKDRQDAVTARIITEDHPFTSQYIGVHNAQMINNLIVDIVNNSYGKDYIRLSDEAFSDLKTAKRENYKFIYFNDSVQEMFEDTVKPMFSELFYRLCEDVSSRREESMIFRHHIIPLKENIRFYSDYDYLSEPAPMIAADYIASMTDDYFVELYKLLFPESRREIRYHSYFDK